MKITESQLRAVIKQELKKVLRENVQDVQALVASFDELKYIGGSNKNKIIKFNKGVEVGPLSVSELKQLLEYVDQKNPQGTTYNDTLGYSGWSDSADMDILLSGFGGDMDVEDIAGILSTQLNKKVSQYTGTSQAEKRPSYKPSGYPLPNPTWK